MNELINANNKKIKIREKLGVYKNNDIVVYFVKVSDSVESFEENHINLMEELEEELLTMFSLNSVNKNQLSDKRRAFLKEIDKTVRTLQKKFMKTIGYEEESVRVYIDKNEPINVCTIHMSYNYKIDLVIDFIEVDDVENH